ncbi:MAG: exodeoxyribonuclease VII large subunit [Clostridia bacterium]|nr:exodeoxyribonuclease VII large subunit [Clostridia bacterium]
MNYLNRDAFIGVGALNQYIHDLMQQDEILSDIRVCGEVSNFKRHPSGHLYFSLKDEGGVIRCVMFRSAAQKLKFAPADGMKLFARGSVGVYSATGQYQLYVSQMDSDGLGSLHIAFEALKKKLAEEGLFDEARKKKIPLFPRKIGLVTSPSGAAVQDMLNILGRRFPLAEVVLYPSLVQGVDAPASLVRGIRYFEANPPDVIIIGRGGGSIEDLWCFNDEGLAREIAACEIPVISAVGHETDFTICDFVADLRAPTPSAAAELAVPDVQDVSALLVTYLGRAKKALASRVGVARTRLNALKDAGILTNPVRMLTPHVLRLGQLEERLVGLGKERIASSQHALSVRAEKLSALNPLGVLHRGFAVVSDAAGAPVTTVAKVTVGERVSIQLKDGTLGASITSITAQTGETGESHGRNDL